MDGNKDNEKALIESNVVFRQGFCVLCICVFVFFVFVRLTHLHIFFDTSEHSSFQKYIFVYLCICVFAHQIFMNIIFEALVT